MKNKVVIILLIILLSLTSSCACNHNKKEKTMLKSFEIESKKSENIDGTLKIKITLKNKSKQTKKIPKIYIKLVDKNGLEIASIVREKNKDTYYTHLHLPKTVLTAGEYIDIMSRL